MATPAHARAPAMDIHAFGEALIKTRDLDPVYLALAGAQLPHAQLCRWLVAYWCFYHAGVASAISEDPDGYWANMEIAAGSVGNMPWPRNVERRHFRGEKALRCVEAMSKWAPEYWVKIALTPTDNRDLPDQETVMLQVQEWPLFGPWIAFKVADMLEVLGLAPLRFDRSIPLIYEEPRKALDILTAGKPGSSPEHHLSALLMYFSTIKEPTGRRMCGVQEVETILCKWKSHQSGHHTAYWVGHDTASLRRDLDPAKWGLTAHRLLQHAPADTDGVRVTPPPVDPRAWMKTPEYREKRRLIIERQLRELGRR